MTVSKLLTAAAVAALLQGVASAQSPPPEQAGKPTQPTHPAVEGKNQGASFDVLDTDRDGRISKTEAEADAKVSQKFTMYDKNGNGFIEKDEVMSPDSSPTEEAPKQ
jgi:EF hand domain-containing protein